MGNQGIEYLRAQKDCERAAAVAGFDSNAVICEKVRREYPSVVVAGCLDELKSQSLDGLILALPHHCYEETWDDLLAFGCPMLKEKPLGRNIKEAQSFVGKAKDQGCAIQTAIQRRQHPSYIRLAEELKNQTLLEVRAHLHLGFGVVGVSDSWRTGPAKRVGSPCSQRRDVASVLS